MIGPFGSSASVAISVSRSRLSERISYLVVDHMEFNDVANLGTHFDPLQADHRGNDMTLLSVPGQQFAS